MSVNLREVTKLRRRHLYSPSKVLTSNSMISWVNLISVGASVLKILCKGCWYETCQENGDCRRTYLEPLFGIIETTEQENDEREASQGHGEPKQTLKQINGFSCSEHIYMYVYIFNFMFNDFCTQLAFQPNEDFVRVITSLFLHSKNNLGIRVLPRWPY